jgi:hypothetical protein
MAMEVTISIKRGQLASSKEEFVAREMARTRIRGNTKPYGTDTTTLAFGSLTSIKAES